MTLSPRMQRCISSLWHTLFLCVVVVVCSSAAQTPPPFLPYDQLIAVNCPHLQEAVWLSDVSNWKVAARSSRPATDSTELRPLTLTLCCCVSVALEFDLDGWSHDTQEMMWNTDRGQWGCVQKSKVHNVHNHLVMSSGTSVCTIFMEGCGSFYLSRQSQCPASAMSERRTAVAGSDRKFLLFNSHLMWALSFYFGPCPIY